MDEAERNSALVRIAKIRYTVQRIILMDGEVLASENTLLIETDAGIDSYTPSGRTRTKIPWHTIKEVWYTTL